VTINNNAGPLWFGTWNENNLNPLSRINWRASLVPAAAVIPAPIAYTKVVAVKKLVVEFLIINISPYRKICVLIFYYHPQEKYIWYSFIGYRILVIYCEQNRVFKAGLCR
jgi:hypothetical protein